MRGFRRSTLLAVSVVLFGATSIHAEQICRPTFDFKQVRFSAIKAQRRSWTGILSVNATECASTSGPFDIGFLRMKESAPDLIFIERFTWKPKQVEVSVTFWEDEAVADHWINNVPTCPCRTGE
jgi:hypothetical protein